MNPFVRTYHKTKQFFKRALYLNVGPLKNPDYWKGMLMGFNKSKANVNEKTAQSIPAYFRAITIIAEQIASLPFSIYEKTDGGVKEATSHPLYNLINFRPSPLYNSFDFKEAFVRQLQLRGDSFIQIIRNGATGRVQEFRIIDPPVDMFEMEGQWYYRFSNINKTLRHDEVIHLKAFTKDGIKGESTLKILREVFGLGISQIDFAAGYYGNGAHLSGVLESDKSLTKDQAKVVIDTWNMQHTGPENFGKTGLLQSGFKYKPISGNMQESQYIESRRLTVEDISNITGVNPILLGNLERATFSNVEELNRIFVQFTLRSWCKRIEAEFNSKLFTDQDQGRYFVRFNLDGLLRGDTKARTEYYKAMRLIDAISPNEIRSLENMNPREGGDKFGLPLVSNTKEKQESNAE